MKSNKTLLAALLIASLFLTLGSGSGSGSDPQGKVVVAPKLSAGSVTLGPVKGAKVTIYPFQSDYESYLLYETESNENGHISIDIDKVKAHFSESGLSSEFLLIVAEGGIDTDPNDDGISIDTEFKNVEGNVYGLIKQNTITEDSQFNINLISSALVDFFLGKDDISSNDINLFLSSLAFIDKTEDGVIDLDDVIAYDMIQDDSTVESTLRELYLEYIHDGNDDMRKLSLDNISDSNNIYEIKTSLQTSALVEMEISPKTSESYIRYYYIDQPNLLIDGGINQTISISLDDGAGLYFKECFETSECSEYELIFYADSRIHKGSLPMASFPDNLYKNQEQISVVRGAYFEAIDTYKNYSTLKPEWENDIETAELKILELDSDIENINIELNSVGQGY